VVPPSADGALQKVRLGDGPLWVAGPHVSPIVMHSADMAQYWMLPNPATSGHGPVWQVLAMKPLAAQQTWPGWQLEELVQALHTVIGSDGSVASGPHVSPCGQSADESQSWNVMANP
jgi:hypothetical protein